MKAKHREAEEDKEDIEAVKERAREPSLNFEDVIKALKMRGKL